VIYDDPVYGRVEIDEPVLLELINTAAVQRLKGVMQYGVTALIGVTHPITRFEHSVGVMLLTRRLGATLDEQIAALLHDVSHTAFSHVIDFVFGGNNRQSYHDEKKEEYVAATDIPACLASHGYDWHGFLNEETFSLLEQAAPALCADRLDYFLRGSIHLSLSTLGDVQHAVRHLLVHDERIGVDDLAVARWLAYTFIAADQASWANFREVGIYEVTAQAIRRGLEIGLITAEDFWGTDEILWDKLHSSYDDELNERLSLISSSTRFIRDEHSPTFYSGTKLRSIDPDVLIDNKLCPLSTLDNDFKKYRDEYLGSNQNDWPMRVVSMGSV